MEVVGAVGVELGGGAGEFCSVVGGGRGWRLLGSGGKEMGVGASMHAGEVGGGGQGGVGGFTPGVGYGVVGRG